MYCGVNRYAAFYCLLNYAFLISSLVNFVVFQANNSVLVFLYMMVRETGTNLLMLFAIIFNPIF